nr:hypothetical protein [Planctomyces sp. SH-PL62]
MRLLGPVELAVLAAGGRPTLDGGREPAAGELLAHTGHGRDADVERLGDPAVGPAVAFGVGLEHDAGPGDGRGRMPARGREPLQLPSLFGGEAYDELVLQSHDLPLGGSEGYRDKPSDQLQ